MSPFLVPLSPSPASCLSVSSEAQAVQLAQQDHQGQPARHGQLWKLALGVIHKSVDTSILRNFQIPSWSSTLTAILPSPRFQSMTREWQMQRNQTRDCLVVVLVVQLLVKLPLQWRPIPQPPLSRPQPPPPPPLRLAFPQLHL